MPIYGDWQSALGVEGVGSAMVEPAAWYVDGTGEYWRDPTVDTLDTPWSSTGADVGFSGAWPDVTPRGWSLYWSQELFNLNALKLVTTRDTLGHSARGRDVAQEVRLNQVVNDPHPGFVLPPEGFDLIQFEGEDEPLPLTEGVSYRGRPVAFTEFRLHLEAGRTEGTTLDDPEWDVEYSVRDSEWEFGVNGIVRPVWSESRQNFGVVDSETGPPDSWLSATSTTDTSVSTDLILEPDASGACPSVLLRVVVGEFTGDPPDEEDAGDTATFEVTAMSFYATPVWPDYRYVRSATGQWNHRQRQGVSGNAGGWPTRQRQNGGATGGWPHRQRQASL